ncbi:BhlA/UviB family holin-like peptide [Clostridium intestinale]|uniref:BhlA/UviB family holin-like peptide n=1 Tax=Clostridium intestinale TaxID=36845 RepID=UPI0028E7296E|nr:BhlA/UviB family holin-like peptide [Clostridium intestinale]
MESEIVKYVITQGIFCVLFVWLLMDTRKDSKEREVKYQETIDKLASSIGIIEDIKEDVEDIKEIILK